MDKTLIPQADLLDILFDGRNKEYGAYDLRKTYNRRLTKSIAATLLSCLLLLIGYVVAGKMDKNRVLAPTVTDTVLTDVLPPPDKPIEPPPPPKVQQPQVAMKIFTPPKIVPNEQVKPDEVPPKTDDLENVKIGTANHNGDVDDGMIAPPAGDGNKGIVEAPVQKEAVDSIFRKVEIESHYGLSDRDWGRFLEKNLRPEVITDPSEAGTAVIQFIVDKEGNVSNVIAISGPKEVVAEAMRVIRKSGKWTPAIQNGRQVASYKRQPITITLASE